MRVKRSGKSLFVLVFGFLLICAGSRVIASVIVPNDPPGGEGGGGCSPAPDPLPPGAPVCANHQFSTKVMGFHQDDAGGDATIPWQHLTNLSYFAMQAYSDGSLVPWHTWNETTFRQFVQDGHANCVRVGLSVVAYDATGYDYHGGISQFLGANRNVLIQNILAELQASGADGVDVDIEFPLPADGGAYVSFVQALTAAVHCWKNGSYVYVAVPQWDWAGLESYYVALANASDGLQIMGYGYHSIGDESTTDPTPVENSPGPVAPVHSGPPTMWPPILDWQTGAEIQDDLTKTYAWYHTTLQIPSSKLLQGYPFYGIDFPTKTGSVPGVYDWTQRNAQGGTDWHFATASGRCEADFSVARQWDAGSLTPYSVSNVGGKYHQLFCEDLQSLGAKLDLAQANNPAGVFFWAENYIPHNYPFWKIVDQRYRVSPPANQSPEVSMGTPPTIVKDQQVTLNGSATDPDGDGLIRQWTLTSGPRPLTFTAANGTSLVFTPHDWGYHQFTFSATDGLLTGTGTTTILVPGDTNPPTISWTAPPSCVTATVTVHVTASDNSTLIRRIEILVDGVVKATYPGSGATSYFVPWDTTTSSIGTHSVQARAYDWTNLASSTSPVSVWIDVDPDSDGFGSACDNCPSVYNETQVDSDNDGKGNSCDNCPTTPNADQFDCNNNGMGDVCDVWCSLLLRSIPTEDGDIFKNGSTYTTNSTSTTMRVGSAGAYRGLISFYSPYDTSAPAAQQLPQGALVRGALLTLVEDPNMGTGALPSVTVWVKRFEEGSGAFFSDKILQGQDWNDILMVSQIAGTLVPGAPGSASQITFGAADIAKIDRTTNSAERIQFRLHVASGNGLVRWLTGNFTTNPAAQPTLEILYTAP